MSEVRQYRKRPVVVEAVQWTGDNQGEIHEFAGGLAVFAGDTRHVWALTIPTLEGNHQAAVGDYIIKGVKGEFYPCKPDTKVSEHGIIMDTEEVCTLLKGKQTQMRRPMTPFVAGMYECGADKFPAFLFSPIKPGDVLWVQETWRTRARDYDCECAWPRRDGACSCPPDGTPVYYASSLDLVDKECEAHEATYEGMYPAPSYSGRWQDAETMPRDAARLFLHVTAVRAERLQDISAEDILAEDVAAQPDAYAGAPATAREEFAARWDCLRDLLGGGPGQYWADNPWVWVYKFERADRVSDGSYVVQERLS